MSCPKCGCNVLITTNNVTYCEKCGNILKYDTKTNDSKNNNTSKKPPMLYGWICPKCGKVLAPFVSECSCSMLNNLEVTCKNDILQPNLNDISNFCSVTGSVTDSNNISN